MVFTFKHLLVQYINLSYSDFWREMSLKYRNMYPSLTALGEIYLVLPPTSVEAERGFFCQNLIKISLMANLSLNSRMVLIKKGPAMKNFDFNKAFDQWCSKKTGIFFMPEVLKKIVPTETAITIGDVTCDCELSGDGS